MNQQSRSVRQQAAQEFANALDQLKATFDDGDERLADVPLVPDPTALPADAPALSAAPLPPMEHRSVSS
jgi:hypothetical protein